MVGLGGGILSAPILLFLPELLGYEAISVKEVTGLTMTQGLASAVSGVIKHRSYGFVSTKLALYMGVPVGVMALAGALLSRYVSDNGILIVFGVAALIAALLVFLPTRGADRDEDDPNSISFKIPLTVSLGTVIGFAGGIVGQAGSFILIPTMVYVLGIPTRFAIGTNLGVILISASLGLVGKLAVAQVPFLLAAALVAGAIPGAQLGAWLGRRMNPKTLRYILAVIVGGAAIRIWIDVLG